MPSRLLMALLVPLVAAAWWLARPPRSAEPPAPPQPVTARVPPESPAAPVAPPPPRPPPRAGPPTSTTAAPEPEVEQEPDPAAFEPDPGEPLHLVMRRRYEQAASQFAAERADPQWAPLQHDRIAQLTELHGLQQVVLRYECRSQLCRLELDPHQLGDRQANLGINALNRALGADRAVNLEGPPGARRSILYVRRRGVEVSDPELVGSATPD